jgi:hypothetical protein
VAFINAKTLKEACFKLKTMLRVVSEEWYSHTEDEPIYGIGQGSGNSQTIWCFVNLVLLAIFLGASLMKIHWHATSTGDLIACKQARVWKNIFWQVMETQQKDTMRSIWRY